MTYLKYLILILIPIYSNAQNFVIENGKRKGSERFNIKNRSNFIDIIVPSDIKTYTKSPINIVLKKGNKVIKSVSLRSSESSLRLDHSFRKGYYNLSFSNLEVDKSITLVVTGKKTLLKSLIVAVPLFTAYYILFHNSSKNEDNTPLPLPDPPLPGGG